MTTPATDREAAVLLRRDLGRRIAGPMADVIERWAELTGKSYQEAEVVIVSELRKRWREELRARGRRV